MKQKTIFGMKGENRLYVRSSDNNEVLIDRIKAGNIIDGTNTVHLDAEEARKLAIQLLKLSTDPVAETGEAVENLSECNVTVYQTKNPDDTPSNSACIEIEETDEVEAQRKENGLYPCFDIEGEDLERLIALLAKIV